MDEVRVTGDVDLHLVTLDFVPYFQTEVFKHPMDVFNAQVPLEKAQDDEVVDPGVTILKESGYHGLLDADFHLQTHQVLSDADVLFVAIVGAPLVLALLLVDDLHLFLKTHLVDHQFHLAVVVLSSAYHRHLVGHLSPSFRSVVL